MPDSLIAGLSNRALPYEELVLQNVSEIIVITDLQFVVQVWNKAAEKFYGVPASAAIGRSMKDLVQFTYHGSSSASALQQLEQNKVWSGKVSFANPAGATFYFLQTVKFIVRP
jgi:PAS domain S-box-containing protein